MNQPANGLTLTRYRVVLTPEDERFNALVEDIETGTPLAECYRRDVAENIARALEFAWKTPEARPTPPVGVTLCCPCCGTSGPPCPDGSKCCVQRARAVTTETFVVGASEVTESLVREIRDRDAKGRAKYGTTLDRADLSADEWAQHAIEELLDAAGYLRAWQKRNA